MFPQELSETFQRRSLCSGIINLVFEKKKKTSKKRSPWAKTRTENSGCTILHTLIYYLTVTLLSLSLSLFHIARRIFGRIDRRFARANDCVLEQVTANEMTTSVPRCRLTVCKKSILVEKRERQREKEARREKKHSGKDRCGREELEEHFVELPR